MLIRSFFFSWAPFWCLTLNWIPWGWVLSVAASWRNALLLFVRGTPPLKIIFFKGEVLVHVFVPSVFSVYLFNHACKYVFVFYIFQFVFSSALCRIGSGRFDGTKTWTKTSPLKKIIFSGGVPRSPGQEKTYKQNERNAYRDWKNAFDRLPLYFSIKSIIKIRLQIRNKHRNTYIKKQMYE